MPQITNRARFPVDRKEAFDFLTNPANWPRFYSSLTSLAGHGSFAKKDDKVDFNYSVLGRSLVATATLDEFVYGEKVRLTTSVPGLGDVHQEWIYTDTDGGLAVEVTLNTEQPTNFFGKAIDKYVIPRVLQRDLEKTLENMVEMFALGVPTD